jgi:hypothetical protein
MPVQPQLRQTRRADNERFVEVGSNQGRDGYEDEDTEDTEEGHVDERHQAKHH